MAIEEKESFGSVSLVIESGLRSCSSILKKYYNNTSLPQKTQAKGSRKNNFPEFVPSFVSDWVDLREHNRRRRKAYVEDWASEDWGKMA